MKALIVAGVALVAIVGCVPISTPVAPDWTVTVLDTTGAPIEGVLVREEYQNYSAESNGHEVDQRTDSVGKVHFRSQITRASRLTRVFASLASATALAHASYGPKTYVLVFYGVQSANGQLDNGRLIWEGTPSTVMSTVTFRR